VNPKKFYVYNSILGAVFTSVDGGVTFTAAAANLPINGTFRASYAAEGDLWLATPTGLLHSTNSGASFQQISGPTAAYDVAFGCASTLSSYPTIFVYGNIAGVDGVYRSVNGGSQWTPVTDSQHQYGYLDVIAADPNIFGQVYLGTSGRGIIYADPNP
jgi:hypothetical protein